MNRATPAKETPPHFSSSRGQLLQRILKTLVIVASLLLTIQGELHRRSLIGPERPLPALYGLYEVQSFVLDGATRPPLTTDSNRWQRLIIETHGRLSVRFMDGTLARFLWNPAPQALWVQRPGEDAGKFLWSYQKPSEGTLEIEGDLDGHHFAVHLRHRDRNEFLLLNRGFHWVNERPFNQ